MLTIWTYARKATNKNAARIYACSKDFCLWEKVEDKLIHEPDLHARVAHNVALNYVLFEPDTNWSRDQDVYAVPTKRGFMFLLLPEEMQAFDKKTFYKYTWKGIK